MTITPIKTTHRNITPASPASEPSRGARGGIKKVTFGLKQKSETKTDYPVFSDSDGQAAELAARIIENTESFEALKGSLETDKLELKQMVTPHYFEVNHGRHDVPSSVSVESIAGEVLVCFQNRYSLLPDESSLIPVLGDETEKYFRQSFELKIKSEKLPQSKTQELMDELQELFTRYGAADAIEFKQGVKPNADFHAARHLSLTPEENMTLDSACPMISSIKTKGRR